MVGDLIKVIESRLPLLLFSALSVISLRFSREAFTIYSEFSSFSVGSLSVFGLSSLSLDYTTVLSTYGEAISSDIGSCLTIGYSSVEAPVKQPSVFL